MPGGRQEALLGAAFGSLVVVAEEPGGYRASRRVSVQCACGTRKVVLVTSLRSGRTNSCGCGRWRADPERTVSATSRLVVMLSPLTVGQVTAIALAQHVTPAVFCRSAIESFVHDDEAVARVSAVPRRRQPPGATVEVCVRVTPATREQAAAVAAAARQTLTAVCLLALDAATRESGAAPVVTPTMLPQAPRVPGFASRIHVGLHRSWRATCPRDG